MKEPPQFSSRALFGLLLLLSLITFTCAKKGGQSTMLIQSSVFSDKGDIPALYTCQGANISPPLSWSKIPSEAKSLALIVDDPDAPDPAAPTRVFVHWVLYNLPTTSTGLPEAVASDSLPAGTLEGMGDYGKTGYRGPCPPIGTHRYFFKLYALDTVLPDLNQPTKAQLLQAMEGHIIAKTEMIGRYKKS